MFCGVVRNSSAINACVTRPTPATVVTGPSPPRAGAGILNLSLEGVVFLFLNLFGQRGVCLTFRGKLGFYFA